MKTMDELVADVECAYESCPHDEDYHYLKAHELDLFIMNSQLDRLEARLDAFEKNKKQS